MAAHTNEYTPKQRTKESLGGQLFLGLCHQGDCFLFVVTHVACYEFRVLVRGNTFERPSCLGLIGQWELGISGGFTGAEWSTMLKNYLTPLCFFSFVDFLIFAILTN